MSKVFVQLCGCILLMASSLPSIAQTGVDTRMSLAGESFLERFEGSYSVPVSGDIIAGVQLGTRTGKFHPSLVSVVRGAGDRTPNLCLSLSSRDGRYSARNLFKGSNKAGVTGFDFHSKFENELTRYDNELMAILVREVSSCDSTEAGVILPRHFGAERGKQELIVAVNVPAARTIVALLRNDIQVEQTNCVEDKSKVSMAFTGLCSLKNDTGFPDGEYVLEVRVRERFEVVSKKFPLRLTTP